MGVQEIYALEEGVDSIDTRKGLYANKLGLLFLDTVYAGV
jgi:hypothetical protein